MGQPNGKVVAVGDSYEPGTPADRFVLARYTRSGALDQTFGTGGKVTTEFGRSSSAALAVALQPDGRIVAAGAVSGGPTGVDIALARYTANGSLDPTFGVGGRVVTDLQSPFQAASAMVIQPDGKLVVSGYTKPFDSYPDFLVARYTSSGALDQSFGGGGIVSTDFQPGCGALDRTFGIARNGVAIATGGVSDLARQPDGKLVTVGLRSGRSDTDVNFGIARFNRSGLPDKSFHGGEATTDFGAWDMAAAVALQPDGRIVVRGSTERLEGGITQSGDFALARYMGVPNCRVPNVIGKTLRAAKARIARASCRLGRVGHRTSARAPRGHVVAQRPPAGTNLPNGGKVNLIVSLGRG